MADVQQGRPSLVVLKKRMRAGGSDGTYRFTRDETVDASEIYRQPPPYPSDMSIHKQEYSAFNIKIQVLQPL